MSQFEDVVILPREDASAVLAALKAFFDMKTQDFDEVNEVLADLKEAFGIMQRAMD